LQKEILEEQKMDLFGNYTRKSLGIRSIAEKKPQALVQPE
jgi:hypothetical protein